MIVTSLPIVTDVSPLHSEKAAIPMLVTRLPIVTEVSIEQLLNAPKSKLPPVLLPVIVTDLKELGI